MADSTIFQKGSTYVTSLLHLILPLLSLFRIFVSEDFFPAFGSFSRTPSWYVPIMDQQLLRSSKRRTKSNGERRMAGRKIISFRFKPCTPASSEMKRNWSLRSSREYEELKNHKFDAKLCLEGVQRRIKTL